MDRSVTNRGVLIVSVQSFQTKMSPAVFPEVSILGPQKLQSSVDARCNHGNSDEFKTKFYTELQH